MTWPRCRLTRKSSPDIRELVELYRRYLSVEQHLEQARLMANEDPDPDIREMAREELTQLEAENTDLSEKLKKLLVPKDPRDHRNVLVEIRAGTGGDEAALFAGDLLRMYVLYASQHGWQSQIISSSEIGIGGL